MSVRSIGEYSLFVDEFGEPRIRVLPGLEILKFALEAELTGGWGERVLEDVRNAVSGAGRTVDRTFNATAVIVATNDVRLEDLVDERSLVVNRAEFEKVLSDWLSFIKDVFQAKSARR